MPRSRDAAGRLRRRATAAFHMPATVSVSTCETPAADETRERAGSQCRVFPWRGCESLAVVTIALRARVTACPQRRLPVTLTRGAARMVGDAFEADRSPNVRESAERLPTGSAPSTASVPWQRAGAAPRSRQRRRSALQRPCLTSSLAGIARKGQPSRSKRRKPRCGAVSRALCRTRIGDPFLTTVIRG
jgi:hypothetical protein